MRLEKYKVSLEDLVVTKCKKELENKKLGKGRGKEGWKEGRVKGRRGKKETGKKGWGIAKSTRANLKKFPMANIRKT